MPQAIRVLLADDHPIIRQGLRVLLSTDPDLEIVGECEDGQRAVELAARTKPQVVLMDVVMPFLNGATATRRILKRQPDCRVLALSTYTDEETVKRMLQAGAVGYLTKQSAADELITAIRQVCAGMRYFSQSVAPTARQVIDSECNKTSPNGELNPREKQVVKLIAEGLTNKEIAMRLELNLSQMKYCRERIMDKLNVRNIADLTRCALARGWATLAKPKPAVTTLAPDLPGDPCQRAAPALAAKAPIAGARDCLAA